MAQFAHIGSYDAYNGRMSRAMMDKLFFVDKIDAGLIVDFGSADGTLLRHVRSWLPDVKLIGYDNDPNMVVTASRSNTDPNTDFIYSWEAVLEHIKNTDVKTAIVLSSIIHEVYHYSEPKEIDTFWKRLWEADFDFIIIRDMIPSRSIDRQSDVNDVAKVWRKFLNTKELRDFENRWGSIENNKNLTHFLLKYQYLEPNWEREVKENYIPLYREDLLSMLPGGYEIAYHEHFVLPWLRRAVRNDFGIELKDNTHLKLVLERS